MSCYGSKINKTPSLDRLANEGMRFDRCVVTNSICGPSRACILTGKYSHKNGFFMNGNRFDGAQPTFPKMLQKAGYQTAIVGKWHLASEPTGFDFWKVLPGQGRYYSPQFRTPEGQVVMPGYVTDVVTDESLRWLAEERDESKPFMLMMQHKAPHRAWQPGSAHVGDFAGDVIPEPETLFDDHSGLTQASSLARMRVLEDMRQVEDSKVFDENSPYAKRLFKLMTPKEQAAWKDAYFAENEEFLAAKPTGKDRAKWNYQRYIKDYLKCIASVDDSVGRMLDYLEESGLSKNTIVIYSSDQGFYLGEHGWYDKRFIYEESLRTPLLVRWPGVTKAGSVDERLVSNLDFAPTFLAAAGLDAPEDMQGASIKPILAGEESVEWRDAFYYHYYEGLKRVHNVAEHYGVVTDRYKLVHYYLLGDWELLDREKDPLETQNFYDKPEYAEVQAKLKKQLAELRKQVDIETDDAVVH